MYQAEISTTEIFPPSHAARAVMDEGELRELSESMKRVGLLQSIVVKRIDNGFEVIAGHRRLLAAQMAGLVTMSCRVREDSDPPPEAIMVQENLYREDMTPVEEAAFYGELFYAMGEDVDRVATLVHQSRNYVENRLALLNGDPVVLQAVADKKISLGMAEELNKFKLEKDRHYYLDWVIRVGATVANAREWRRGLELRPAAEPGQATPDMAPPGVTSPDPDPQRCLFCESAEDPWAMRFAMVHSYCLRQAEERRCQESGVRSEEWRE